MPLRSRSVYFAVLKTRSRSHFPSRFGEINYSGDHVFDYHREGKSNLLTSIRPHLAQYQGINWFLTSGVVPARRSREDAHPRHYGFCYSNKRMFYETAPLAHLLSEVCLNPFMQRLADLSLRLVSNRREGSDELHGSIKLYVCNELIMALLELRGYFYLYLVSRFTIILMKRSLFL